MSSRRTNRHGRWLTTLDVMGRARTSEDLARLLERNLQPLSSADSGVAIGVYVDSALAAHRSRVPRRARRTTGAAWA